MIKQNNTKDKYNALRTMCIKYADLKHRALMVWKENVQYFNSTMERVKLRLIELHRRNISKAFYKWKDNCDK